MLKNPRIINLIHSIVILFAKQVKFSSVESYERSYLKIIKSTNVLIIERLQLDLLIDEEWILDENTGFRRWKSMIYWLGYMIVSNVEFWLETFWFWSLIWITAKELYNELFIDVTTDDAKLVREDTWCPKNWSSDVHRGDYIEGWTNDDWKRVRFSDETYIAEGYEAQL